MITLSQADTRTAVEQVASLARQIWPGTYRNIISQAQIEYMLHRFYAAETLWQQLSDLRHIYLIRNDGQTIVYIDIECRKNDHFIHKFYILTERQGKGTGSEAMNVLFKLVDLAAMPVRLQVNRENYKAINFYFKNGFIIESVLDLDIGNGFYMNDFLMIKQ